MTTRYTKSTRKKIHNLLLQEEEERNVLIKNSIQMSDIILKHAFANINIDDYIFCNMDEHILDYCESDDVNICLLENSIWHNFATILKKNFIFECYQKHDEFNDEMTMLKIELDEWYGETPEEGSPASLGKIVDFGFSRSDSLKKLKAWKFKKLQEFKNIINLCENMYCHR